MAKKEAGKAADDGGRRDKGRRERGEMSDVGGDLMRYLLSRFRGGLVAA